MLLFNEMELLGFVRPPINVMEMIKQMHFFAIYGRSKWHLGGRIGEHHSIKMSSSCTVYPTLKVAGCWSLSQMSLAEGGEHPREVASLPQG